jgi:hypothetical protein
VAEAETSKNGKPARFIDLLEGAFILAAAIIAFGIGLLDLFGLLDAIPILANRVPVLTLLLLSLALGLFFLLRTRVEAIEDIKTGLIATQRDISLVLSQRVLADIEKTIGSIDADLRLVFESDIRELLGSIILAMHDRSIKITEIERYRYYYIRTLANFPKTTILATSIPSSKYFWRNPAVEIAIANFIQEGGIFKRIFFLDDIADMMHSEVQEILRKQLEINVETYVVPITAVNPRLNTLFVVESHKRIGWQIYTDDNKRISSVVATTDQEKTGKFLEIFDQLLQTGETHRVTQADILEPTVATILDPTITLPNQK